MNLDFTYSLSSDFPSPLSLIHIIYKSFIISCSYMYVIFVSFLVYPASTVVCLDILSTFTWTLYNLYSIFIFDMFSILNETVLLYILNIVIVQTIRRPQYYFTYLIRRFRKNQKPLVTTTFLTGRNVETGTLSL